MTDRIKGFIVTLDADYREDGISQLADAIMLFRGVIGILPLKADPSDSLARARVRIELRDKLLQLLDDPLDPI